jgi:hypothetical protein
MPFVAATRGSQMSAVDGSGNGARIRSAKPEAAQLDGAAGPKTKRTVGHWRRNAAMVRPYRRPASRVPA